MSLKAAFEYRRKHHDYHALNGSVRRRPIEVAVQGTGAWVKRTIQPQLRELHRQLTAPDDRGRGGRGLIVSYVGIEKNAPLPIQDGEELYFCRDDAAQLQQLSHRSFDAVIVASPDWAHIDDVLWWLDQRSRLKAIFVEKPFSDESHEIAKLRARIAELGRQRRRVPPIFGIDHYNFYFRPFADQVAEIEAFVGDVKSISFSMLENNPIEHDRLRSLRSGLTFDMASHFLGFLSLFCDLRTTEQLEVLYRDRHDFDQYGDLRERKYFAETSVELAFKVLLWNTQTGVAAYCRAGKAAGKNSKFFEFGGNASNIARIDKSEADADADHYPWGGLFFGSAHKRQSERQRRFPDPHDVKDAPKTFLQELSDAWFPPPVPNDELHSLLIRAIVTGIYDDYVFLLSINECDMIVRKLEQAREELIGFGKPPHIPGHQAWSGEWPRGTA